MKTVNGIDDALDDVYILPLVEASNIVGLCYLTVMEDAVDGTCMIYYIAPIAYVLALAIDRK